MSVTSRTLRRLCVLSWLLLGGLSRVAGAQAPDTGTPSPDAAAAVRAGLSDTSNLPAPGETPLSGPIDPAVYLLGPGDGLSLELSGRTVRQTSLVVDAEGRVNVPELGVLDVGGKSLAAVRAQIIGRLKGLYQGVRIDLRLVHVREFKVFVTGQVKQPGAVLANGGMRASELFRGDLSLLPGASRRNIDLRRRDGAHRRVDLDAFAYMGRDADDPFLDDGDVLVVPPRTERVFALGGFGRPGEYEFAPGDSLADLIGLAGGLLPGAEANPGTLVHFVSPSATESLSVDYSAVRRGAWDAPLSNQDRLFARVPSGFLYPRNATVVGEVVFPGPYSIREGADHVSSLLARAGGLTPQAARERIQVFRPGPTSDQRDIEFERLSRLSRSEMTDAEYQVFKTKLASQQSAFVVSYDQLVNQPATFDILARDGDIIVVERATEIVRVAGEVRRPSLLDYDPARSPREYIELAGGFTNRAQTSKVRVTHAGSNQPLMLADVKSIQPGDFIWVPEKSDVSFWSIFKDVITVAGAVATIIVLVDNTRHP